MSSDTSSAGNLARRITMPLFKLGLAVFLLLGVIVVGAQAVGVVTANAGLVSGVVDSLGKAMTVAAGVTGLLGFAMSYLFKWQNAGED
ncbi:hypothetical protein [Saccharopolyspora pogona]|uniref:hypothetical protein n=1 Tax=Saccharopolyspora pogona TaxID=333966 RepID=UPI001689DB93|nr:hypothetical protein [Saccharopolyspora pogona]